MPQPIRILELRSVLGTGGGPEKTILLGSAMADPSRYAITVCYIRDLRDPVFGIDARAAELGLDYVEVRERHSFDFTIWPRLRQLVRKRRIDIVHSHDYKTNLYAWLLGRHERVIPLATLHGYTGHSWREMLYYAADKRVVRRFPLTVAVSGDLRQELIRTGSDPSRVIRVLNGIDDRAFFRQPSLRPSAREALGVPGDAIVVGAVGRLERQKRFELLMEAFAVLRERLPHLTLRLVIAGDGSLRTRLEQRRDELGLKDSCLLAGHRGDVALLHHAFDVFVQSSDYEGTPNAVLEAMAFETPLVATDVGGTRELVDHQRHGLIIAPGQVSTLAEAIGQVIADPDGARARAKAARSRVETELSFRTRMATIETLYDRLMSGRANPTSSRHEDDDTRVAAARVQ